MSAEQDRVRAQLEDVKRQLMEIGDMRPGNLNQQFRKPKEVHINLSCNKPN